MRDLHSHSREYRKIHLRDHFPHISQILEGIDFGANTCRACIHTRANTGRFPGELFMYWFRARGCRPAVANQLGSHQLSMRNQPLEPQAFHPGVMWMVCCRWTCFGVWTANLHDGHLPDGNAATDEQQHFYANKAETEVRHFCLKRLKKEIPDL